MQRKSLKPKLRTQPPNHREALGFRHQGARVAWVLASASEGPGLFFQDSCKGTLSASFNFRASRDDFYQGELNASFKASACKGTLNASIKASFQGSFKGTLNAAFKASCKGFSQANASFQGSYKGALMAHFTVLRVPIREFPKIRGTLFGGPYNKGPTIWGAILGSHIFENSQRVLQVVIMVIIYRAVQETIKGRQQCLFRPLFKRSPVIFETAFACSVWGL